ncbi:MAG: hypothetical protein CSA72_13930 [Rhodobacterales bacterium]|nr:MAG: hypothetical protein CSA72_13930 [Rhodobacterales bacterium]
MLAGNALPEGAEPIALRYGGHQFGHWAGQLGDGRAVLLGEAIAPDGARFDLQLKGSGRTPYSRGGDGQAWLGPVLREYLMSEAMAALGIPTTRALGAAYTGAQVIREGRALPGAVLTRVAASHIRVGSFEILAASGDTDGLQTLLDYTLARHYPQAEGAYGLVEAVARAQGELIAHWMSVGFIHGVMNTDNCALSGETIDYGPCAFMEAYSGARVFSSIDHMGRYAYQNQPSIGLWNLGQLAMALSPIAEGLEGALTAFQPAFQAGWLRRFRAKIGLRRAEESDAELIVGLLQRMSSSGADFTNTFSALGEGNGAEYVCDDGAWESWEPQWRARLLREEDGGAGAGAVMAAANPAVIARGHLIERAIARGLEGDLSLFHRLNTALATPFAPTPEFMQPAPPEERVTRTFCGT